ncbi:MAG: ATP-binding cassette domain-containing protein [Phycisphaerales bacterium]
MITLDHIHKRYGRVHAVRGVSLDIPRGQVVGILGPNGAGKSTTIRMVTGAIPPTEGRVTLDGLDSVDDSVAVRRRIGYLPESNPLYPEMRVRDYLGYRARLYAMSRASRRERIGRVLERCRVDDMRDRRIGTLSKGYRQRVGLAAALLHDPPVLVLDEPTSGLDPAQIAETRSLITELSGDRTMLLVSHVLPEVEKTCTRIVVFAGGTVRADGSPEDLTARGDVRYILETRPGIDERVRALPQVARVDAAPSSDGFVRQVVTPVDGADPRTELFRLSRDAGAEVRELRREAEPLERFYLRLVERVAHEDHAEDAP